MKKYYSGLFLFMLSCCHSEAFAQTFAVELPSNASTAWVANKLNQNGMLLSIKSFHSDDAVDNVLSFFRERWHRDGVRPGYVENELGDWRLISRLREYENTVLQLKENSIGGSIGFLSIAYLNQSHAAAELDIPLPDDTKTYASSHISEHGSEATTLTLISQQSPRQVSRIYRDLLSRKGWSTVLDDVYQNSFVLVLNNNKKKIELVIQTLNEDESVIFINHVKRDV